MPRTRRMLVKGEDAVYHIMSRTALDRYVLGDIYAATLNAVRAGIVNPNVA